METVPPRNDPKKGLNLRSESQAAQLAGLNPDLHYEWFSTKPDHPSYIGNRLVDHEIGSPQTKYVTVDAWKVVDSNDGVSQPGRKRADDSKGIDTARRHGSLVLACTPKENAAKYAWFNEAKADLADNSLTKGTHEGDRFARSFERVHRGHAESGDHEVDVNSVLGMKGPGNG